MSTQDAASRRESELDRRAAQFEEDCRIRKADLDRQKVLFDEYCCARRAEMDQELQALKTSLGQQTQDRESALKKEITELQARQAETDSMTRTLSLREAELDRRQAHIEEHLAAQRAEMDKELQMLRADAEKNEMERARMLSEDFDRRRAAESLKQERSTETLRDTRRLLDERDAELTRREAQFEESCRTRLAEVNREIDQYLQALKADAEKNETERARMLQEDFDRRRAFESLKQERSTETLRHYERRLVERDAELTRREAQFEESSRTRLAEVNREIETLRARKDTAGESLGADIQESQRVLELREAELARREAQFDENCRARRQAMDNELSDLKKAMESEMEGFLAEAEQTLRTNS